MNRLINKLSEYLAAPKSRRGFIRTISRVTVGVSAVAAGIALGTGVASASPDLTCCTSTDPVQHQNEHLCSPPNNGFACPYGTFQHGSWTCCPAHDCMTHQNNCWDCYNNSDASYNCTWGQANGTICSCDPPRV